MFKEHSGISVYQLYQRVLLFRFLCCKNSSKCNCMIMTRDIQYFMVLLLTCSNTTFLHFRRQIPTCFVGMLCFDFMNIVVYLSWCSVAHCLCFSTSCLCCHYCHTRSFLNFHFLLTLSSSQQQQYPFPPPWSCFFFVRFDKSKNMYVISGCVGLFSGWKAVIHSRI